VLLKGRVAKMLNLAVDLSGFYRLCRREPSLRYVPRSGAGRFLSSGSVYEDVFKAICCTNLSWNQAVAAVNRIGELGEPAGEGGRRSFPGPATILAAGAARLSEISRLGYRVPYLLKWAGKVQSGGPDWRAAESGDLPREELRRFLLSVSGIGPTSSRYLMMMRGLSDEIPVDSSTHLFLREAKALGRRRLSPRLVAHLYGRFGPWKALAYWFEFLPWARKHWSMGG
jgi:3-methyladenine DNA glycosylase/8-oxoguanine DNA glycosylase